MKNNLEKVARKIDSINDRYALGYESTLDFNYGYIMALLQFGIITLKEKNALMKVYSATNDNCDFAIENGKLVCYKDSE